MQNIKLLSPADVSSTNSGSENWVLICAEVMVCRFDMFLLSISVLGQLLVIGLIISDS